MPVITSSELISHHRPQDGKQGMQGEQGTQGIKGDRGEQGSQGIKGDRGEQGSQGIKGDRGEQGTPGIKGDRGEQSDRGEQGIQGIQGDKGEQGIHGIKGDQGDHGPPMQVRAVCVDVADLSSSQKHGVCYGDRRFNWFITGTMLHELSYIIDGSNVISKTISINQSKFVQSKLSPVYNETECCTEVGVWGSFRTGPCALSVWPFGTRPVWSSSPYRLLTSEIGELCTSDPNDAFDTYPVLNFHHHSDSMDFYIMIKTSDVFWIRTEKCEEGGADIIVEFCPPQSDVFEMKTFKINTTGTWANIEGLAKGTLIRSVAFYSDASRWMGLSLDSSKSLVNHNQLPLYTRAKAINPGGHIDFEPINGIHYMFAGVRWIDTGELGVRGCLAQKDTRYAAYGYKHGTWTWLGTCSMNNSDVADSTDHTVATSKLHYEHMPNNTCSSHTVRWTFSNLDFYAAYRIKNVKAQSAPNGIIEIEFF